MTDEIREQNMSRNSPHREQFSLSSRLPDVSRIRTYYDETWLDYRMLWLNPQNRCTGYLEYPCYKKSENG
jgi:hypothetical protein